MSRLYFEATAEIYLLSGSSEKTDSPVLVYFDEVLSSFAVSFSVGAALCEGAVFSVEGSFFISVVGGNVSETSSVSKKTSLCCAVGAAVVDSSSPEGFFVQPKKQPAKSGNNIMRAIALFFLFIIIAFSTLLCLIFKSNGAENPRRY